MDKLSANQVLSAFREIPGMLRKLAEERDILTAENVELQKQLDAHQLNERVEKIAHEVHDKGIQQGRTMDETREFLLQKAASGELDVVEQAVGMTSPQMNLGTLGEIPRGGESTLEEFVTS